MPAKPSPANCVSCRGEHVRESLVRRYQIRPVQQGRILPGHSKTSCTGDELTDHYYVFECRPKVISEGEAFTLVCGHHAARHFLDLTGAAPPPMFDPFLAEPGAHSGASGSAGTTASHGSASAPLHPVGQQLLIAAQLTCAIARHPPKRPLLDVMAGARAATSHPPPVRLIASLNTIFGNIAPGRTLHGVLAGLSASGRVRRCTFELLHQLLVDHYPDRAAASIYRAPGV